ncbi:MAG: PEP-CTERM sorting domain-containing protein [Planctomycetota bacterium]
MKLTARISIFLSCVALCAGSVFAQSATYDPMTGIMTVDSGNIDLVAVFIEGPDVSAGMGCNLCDGMQMPAEDPAGFDASTWTLGFINGSSQWIRTNPLQGRGFVGTIADSFVDGMGMDQPWPDDFPPFLDFPDVGGGIANYGTGLGAGDFGLVTYASDDGSTTTSGVTVIPEPATAGLLSIAGLALLGLRRRS